MAYTVKAKECVNGVFGTKISEKDLYNILEEAHQDSSLSYKEIFEICDGKLSFIVCSNNYYNRLKKADIKFVVDDTPHPFWVKLRTTTETIERIHIKLLEEESIIKKEEEKEKALIPDIVVVVKTL